MEELDAVVKMLVGDKAPELDGFDMTFFQKCWHILRDDVFKFDEQFYYEGNLERSFNATFMTLILKKKGAMEIKDFRPI